MRKILSPELDDSVVLVDTGSIKQLQKERKASLNSDDPLCSNIWEVSIIFQLTKVLLKVCYCKFYIGKYVIEIEFYLFRLVYQHKTLGSLHRSGHKWIC